MKIFQLKWFLSIRCLLLHIMMNDLFLFFHGFVIVVLYNVVDFIFTTNMMNYNERIMFNISAKYLGVVMLLCLFVIYFNFLTDNVKDLPKKIIIFSYGLVFWLSWSCYDLPFGPKLMGSEAVNFIFCHTENNFPLQLLIEYYGSKNGKTSTYHQCYYCMKKPSCILLGDKPHCFYDIK